MQDVSMKITFEELKAEYKKLTQNIEPKLAGEAERLKLLETQLDTAENDLKSVGITDVSPESLQAEFERITKEIKELYRELEADD